MCIEKPSSSSSSVATKKHTHWACLLFMKSAFWFDLQKPKEKNIANQPKPDPGSMGLKKPENAFFKIRVNPF